MKNPFLDEEEVIPEPWLISAVDFEIPVVEVPIGIMPEDYKKPCYVHREYAMPNSCTFEIPPIKKLVDREIQKGGTIIDPFAGKSKDYAITNDLNPDLGTMFCTDAKAFLESLPDECADLVLYDPPFSFTQAAQVYKSYGKEKLVVSVGNMKYWSFCRWHVARILKVGGRCISIGWNSMGLGSNRGCVKTEIMLVAHGGGRNDTICTLEYKICRYQDLDRWKKQDD